MSSYSTLWCIYRIGHSLMHMVTIMTLAVLYSILYHIAQYSITYKYQLMTRNTCISSFLPSRYPALSLLIYSKKDTEFLLSLLLFFLLICLNPPTYPCTIKRMVRVENCMSSGIFENSVGNQSIDILRQFSPLH